MIFYVLAILLFVYFLNQKIEPIIHRKLSKILQLEIFANKNNNPFIVVWGANS